MKSKGKEFFGNAFTIDKDYRPSKVRLISIFVVFGLAYFFSHFHRLALAVISTQLANDFSMDATKLGILGSAYFYPYALMQIPGGFLADRLGSKILISVSLIIAAAGSLCFGLAKTFPQIVIARALVGFGVACIYVPSLRGIREWFDNDRFGVYTGLLMSMGTIGALSASTPLSLLTSLKSWRWLFVVIGIITIFLAVVAWFVLLPNKDKEKSLPESIKSEDYKITIRSIVTKFSFIALILWFFFFAGTKLSFQGLWAAPYFASVYKFSKEQISIVLMCFAIGNILGSPFAGNLADKWGSNKVLISFGIIFSLLWLVIAMITGPIPFVLSCIFYFVMGFLGIGALVAAFSSIRNIGSKKISGTLLGFVNTAAFLGTAIITQFSGKLVNSLFWLGTINSYRILFLIFFICSFLCTILIWLRQRFTNNQEKT